MGDQLPSFEEAWLRGIEFYPDPDDRATFFRDYLAKRRTLEQIIRDDFAEQMGGSLDSFVEEDSGLNPGEQASRVKVLEFLSKHDTSVVIEDSVSSGLNDSSLVESTREYQVLTNELSAAHALIVKLKRKAALPSITAFELQSAADKTRKMNGSLNYSKLCREFHCSDKTIKEWCRNFKVK